MGRQITVDLADLSDKGCVFRVVRDATGDDYRWVEVVLPDGRTMGSYGVDCLHFDCRSMEHSANGWMEAWLIENQVPYAEG